MGQSEVLSQEGRLEAEISTMVYHKVWVICGMRYKSATV